jgi:ectoine hydroxylase-related dioxygenase (phytanoyl-CoA dioxygenase family)
MAVETELTRQQLSFYETFGFLKLPGLFRDEIDDIASAFESVFADETHPRMEYYAELHGERRRIMIPKFVDKSPVLDALKTDPRILGTVAALLGPAFEYAESDGNLLDCDTSWHCDVYGSPLESRHLKLAFYLDPVAADSGALRMIPGTCHFRETFATTLRRRLADPNEIAAQFGVDAIDIPYWPVATEPGDVVALDFRTLHASFFGTERRRLFTMNFRETTSAQGAASGSAP